MGFGGVRWGQDGFLVGGVWKNDVHSYTCATVLCQPKTCDTGARWTHKRRFFVPSILAEVEGFATLPTPYAFWDCYVLALGRPCIVRLLAVQYSPVPVQSQ